MEMFSGCSARDAFLAVGALRRLAGLPRAQSRRFYAGKRHYQVVADVMTLQEKKGPVAEAVVAWSGDGNNVAVSWLHAAARFGFELRLACPDGLRPPAPVLDWAQSEGARIHLFR